jgi:hypothetical protein
MTPLIILQLRLATLNHELLNREMKIRKRLSSLRRISCNKQVNIATHWSYRSNDHEMHLQLLPTRISHRWIQHAQQCTFTRKLNPSMRHDIWNWKLTLYIIVYKKRIWFVYLYFILFWYYYLYCMLLYIFSFSFVTQLCLMYPLVKDFVCIVFTPNLFLRAGGL